MKSSGYVQDGIRNIRWHSGRLFYTWLDCFTFLKSGAAQVCALGMLLVYNTVRCRYNATNITPYCIRNCSDWGRKWIINYTHNKHTIPWWRHQMETLSALLAICAGNSSVPVNSPHKGQWRGALMFSLIRAWINDWVNNREAGDLRRHRGHCGIHWTYLSHPWCRIIFWYHTAFYLDTGFNILIPKKNGCKRHNKNKTKMFRFPSKFHCNIFLGLDKNSALVQLMAWRRIGD